MRRGRVLSLNRSGVFNHFYKNRILIILALFFLIGIILGVSLLKSSDTAYNVSKLLFEKFINNRTGHSFLHIFLSFLLMALVMYFVMYISGTSFIGVVLSPFVMLAFGYVFGGFLGYVYQLYSIKGIAFNAVIIIPTALFVLIGLLLSGKESLNLSYELLKLTFNSSYSSSNIFMLFKSYCTKYLIYIIFAIVAAVVDGLLSTTILKFFDF